MLTRSFLPAEEQHTLLCYTPMFHARLFTEAPKYRDSHFQPIRGPLTADSPRPGSPDYVPFLDGNPEIDRSLFVQFCANDPAYLLSAAKLVAPYCDAVDLNLGCPQGIAKRGQYGSFLQENQELIFELINTLHKELDIPVTAKIRILDTKEATLKYAQNVLRAGASILTVHGRRREQKGHQTGLADWEYIRYLRENLPKETVIFANGNILQHSDLEKCLETTGADGVMSAEGNLSDPGLFARSPAVGEEGREYWRSKDGRRGGWRVDAVLRRYMDIIYKYVLEQEPPARRPLFMPGDDVAWLEEATSSTSTETTTTQTNNNSDEPPRKKHKSANGTASTPSTTTTNNPHLDKKALQTSPNLVSMQPHCFHLLRHFVTTHTDVRDLLARARNGSEIAKYEAILSQVERKVAQGLLEYERTGGSSFDVDVLETLIKETEDSQNDPESSAKARRENKRPWWVVQPIIRPLPKEALAKGALQLSKKELKAQAAKKAAGGGAGVVAAAGAAAAAAGVAVASVFGETGAKKEEKKDEKGEVKKTTEEAPVPVQGENGAETAVESLETTTSYPKSELVSG